MDTPIVNIGFDGYASEPPERSVARVYDFTHYANLVRAGGVRIARSADEMIAQINAYLENPALDRESRARIVEEQCYRIDGRSGERVGNQLLALMGVPAPDAGAVRAPAPAPIEEPATR